MRDFTVSTYAIREFDTPVFETPGGEYVAPNSDFVSELAKGDKSARNTIVFRIAGVIRKNGANSDLTVKSLAVSAEKYAHPDFKFSMNSDGTVISVSLPEFKRGRGNKVRSFNAKSSAVVGLLGLSAKSAPKK